MKNPDAILRNLAVTSDLLKAMGNPHRLLILCELAHGERSVGELKKKISLSQSALSQHLGRLRNHDIVETRRDAQSIYYSLASEAAAEVLQVLANNHDMASGRRSAVRTSSGASERI